MDLFDHIIDATDEAVAHTLLAGVTYRGHLISQPELDEAGNPTGENLWNQACPVRAILAPAVWDMSELQEPVLVSPEVVAPGFFVLVPQSQPNHALRDLPGGACRIITDRSKAGSSKLLHEYAFYIAPDFNEALLTRDVEGQVISIAIGISPTPAGAAYPFGASA